MMRKASASKGHLDEFRWATLGRRSRDAELDGGRSRRQASVDS
jgi:hypothetical protein